MHPVCNMGTDAATRASSVRHHGSRHVPFACVATASFVSFRSAFSTRPKCKKRRAIPRRPHAITSSAASTAVSVSSIEGVTVADIDVTPLPTSNAPNALPLKFRSLFRSSAVKPVSKCSNTDSRTRLTGGVPYRTPGTSTRRYTRPVGSGSLRRTEDAVDPMSYRILPGQEI